MQNITDMIHSINAKILSGVLTRTQNGTIKWFVDDGAYYAYPGETELKLVDNRDTCTYCECDVKHDNIYLTVEYSVDPSKDIIHGHAELSELVACVKAVARTSILPRKFRSQAIPLIPFPEL